MTPEKKAELKEKIDSDPDFIYSPRHNNSLKKFMEKHPEGATIPQVAKVLLMSVEEVEGIYTKTVRILKNTMGDQEQ